MRVDGLSNAGFTRSAPARQVNGLHGDGLVGLAAGKQPLVRAFPAPIGPQQIQQPGRQQGLAVFVAFAAAYPEDVAGAIDVAHFEFGDLGDSGSGGIHGGQQGAMAEVTRCFEQSLDFFPAQDDRELPLLSWKRNPINARPDGSVFAYRGTEAQRPLGCMWTARAYLP